MSVTEAVFQELISAKLKAVAPLNIEFISLTDDVSQLPMCMRTPFVSVISPVKASDVSLNMEDMSSTEAVFQVPGKTVKSVFSNIPLMFLTAAVFQPFNWRLNADARLNIYAIFVTDAVSMVEISILNDRAPSNMALMSVTAAVFQPEMSPLKSALSRNKPDMSVTSDVFQSVSAT